MALPIKNIRGCAHSGCKVKFEGTPNALYCPAHRSAASRYSRRASLQALPAASPEHLLIMSDSGLPFLAVTTCALRGCEAQYTFVVYPDHMEYPKFCPAHRTPFRREHFAMMRTAGLRCRQPVPAPTWPDHEGEFERRMLARGGSNRCLKTVKNPVSDPF